MRARVLFFLVFWASAQPLSIFEAAAKGRSAKETEVGRGAVERVLRTQEDAWNRHDLEAFMAGFLKSPARSFFFPATEQHGPEAHAGPYGAAHAWPGHGIG